ncbi:MAG: cell division protein ZapA [Lachnospiraceae bacterium]
MSSKTNTEVIIAGKVYTLSGFEGEAYLQKVASYINNKNTEVHALESFKFCNSETKGVLIQLNLADDYFKALKRIEILESEAELRDKDLYDLKHELVTNQVKLESREQELKDLEVQNNELRLTNARLESALPEDSSKS